MRNLNRFAPPALVALCLCLLAGPIAAAEKAPAAPAPAQRKIKAVVLTGGHGYDKKAFPKPFEGHADIACEFTAPQKGKPGLFADVDKWAYDTIVLYNFRQKLSKAEQANFLKLLDRGVGLFILHHALAAYPDWKEYEKILGARYYLKPTEVNGVKHPRSIWKHDVDMKIHVADAGHAITKGMKDFVIHDETYGKWSYFPAGSRLLLTTDAPGSNKQIAWARFARNSRVFALQLGHDGKAYANPNFRRLIAQGMRWTAGRIGKEKPRNAKRAEKEGK